MTELWGEIRPPPPPPWELGLMKQGGSHKSTAYQSVPFIARSNFLIVGVGVQVGIYVGIGAGVGVSIDIDILRKWCDRKEKSS